MIVKIKNEYEGHAQKVMNAMWGAGQMMFNKILVIIDGNINIHNYEEVARIVSANVDPTKDIYISQGPMDVLDHACSKFAFGGKMCLDATGKSQVSSLKSQVQNQIQGIGSKFPEIITVNDSLLQKGISVLFISINKTQKNQVKELNEKLFSLKEFQGVKFVIYVEDKADISNLSDCIWRFANNFDPKRDSYLSEAGIGLDGTRKTKEFDNFDRQWPNIVCADEKTIKSVDEKWSRLFISPSEKGIKGEIPFIPSPSLKYSKQLYKGGAVAEE